MKLLFMVKCAYLGLICTGLFCWVVPAQAATRVALVSTCGGEAGVDVLALAEAKLSQQPDVVLVERREVERVLQEQKLWSYGLTSYQQALAAGKLLGVEAFAALETFPGTKDALGLVVFDAGSGVRISDTTLAPGSPEQVAEAITAAVRAACAKRQRDTGGKRTVCLLSVHNVGLPRDHDDYCEAIGRMVERHLLDSTDVTVLERDRLDQINQERHLPGLEPTDALRASLVLMELEIERAGQAVSIQATARLTDGAGKPLGKFSVQRADENAAGLTAAILDELTRSLKTAPADSRPNPKLEAQRFRQESEFLMGHGETRRALKALEAAVALCPEDLELQLLLVRRLLLVACELLRQNPNQPYRITPPPVVSEADLNASLAMAQRALNIYDTLWRRPDVQERLSSNTQPRDTETYNKFSLYLFCSHYAKGYDDKTNQARARFESQFRTLAIEVINAAEARAVTSPFLFHYYSGWLNSPGIPWLECTSRNTAEFTSAAIGMIRGWLELAKRQPASNTPQFSWFNLVLSQRLKLTPGADADGHAWNLRQDPKFILTTADLQQWRALFVDEQKHSHPGVQIYGQLGQLWVDVCTGQIATNAVASQVDRIVEFALNKAAQPDCEPVDASRLICYRAAVDAANLFDLTALPKEARQPIWNRIVDQMLQRREIVGEILRTAKGGWTGPDFDRALAILDDPGCRWLEGDRDKLKQELVLAKDPAAAGKTVAPWTQAKLILEPQRFGLSSIDAVLVDKEILLAGSGRDQTNSFLQLLQISVPDGHVLSLGKISLPEPGPITATAICRGDDKIYVATTQHGILVTSATGTDGWGKIDRADGLPSDSVVSVAYVDGKVFAGLDEGSSYIICFDTRTRHCDVLAASKRQEIRSPFDNSARPFCAAYLRSDPVRHRVLLALDYCLRDFRYLPAAADTGLWQIGATDGHFDQLLPGEAINWMGQIRDDAVLLNSYEAKAKSVNLRTGAIQALTNKGPFPPPRYSYPCPPYVLVDGWLWTAEPFARVSSDGKVQEFFPALARGFPPYPPQEWRCLESVTDGRYVVAGSKDQLWLLTLPEKSAKEIP